MIAAVAALSLLAGAFMLGWVVRDREGADRDAVEPVPLGLVREQEPAIFKPLEVATAVLLGVPVVGLVAYVSWAGA